MTEKDVSFLNKIAQPLQCVHVEAIRQELVLEVFNCFLQGDDVPLHRDTFFDSSFLFHAEVLGSNYKKTEPLLFGQSVGACRC